MIDDGINSMTHLVMIYRTALYSSHNWYPNTDTVSFLKAGWLIYYDFFQYTVLVLEWGPRVILTSHAEQFPIMSPYSSQICVRYILITNTSEFLWFVAEMYTVAKLSQFQIGVVYWLSKQKSMKYMMGLYNTTTKKQKQEPYHQMCPRTLFLRTDSFWH